MSKWRSLNQLRACEDAACGLPAGFFRLRYFHGKEMRLADYVDEQRYHAGKMRFHNEKLHGAGILCGLKLSVLQPEGTALRVAKGAALDDCGREIVVGFDQCVDVAAWFARQAYEMQGQDDNPCAPDAENRVKLCVLIRYAECVGGPEPAPPAPCPPPDPCACGGGGACGCATPTRAADPCAEGAEFGRVAEEFELRLMFADEARRVSHHELFPDAAEIDAALAGAAPTVGLLSALAPAIRARCPAADDGWLLLGCFHVRVEANDPARVVAIEDVDHGAAAQVLLSTEVIQYLLGGLIDEVGPGMAGPRVGGIGMRLLPDGRYQIALGLTAQIEPTSLEPEASFQIRAMSATGWQVPAANAMVATYGTAIAGDHHLEGPTIYLAFNNANGFLAEGGRYELFATEEVAPIVDDKLRRLRPRHLSWRFGLTTDPGTGALQMQPLGG
ncbi:hypothetical protein ILP92_17060 [Maribius pontilimi]|uniref:Uncharacterized protein n=1 Tax=Palleronia pontilimi TaxID=1964209 RepID=A0A934MDZ3_9RHOB|nr:hypothetical protein [Palleronia pontilimi]MBJ3764448.1 hypothetical protein [Palleronia pontilimi]